MSWRTVVITKHCKLSYKNGYMIVKDEATTQIHLSEIHTLIIDSTMVSISAYLIVELLKEKVKLIFCDEKRNPYGEVVPYYGCHNTSKKIREQLNWDDSFQQLVWTEVVKEKIKNQAKLLKKFHLDGYEELMQYANQVEFFDKTNREAIAAKVYFRHLFGKEFVRDMVDPINISLNYGYAILLSTFNKEIIASGYLTQLGIKHINEYNAFNLSSDLMEPFRVLVDEIVFQNREDIEIVFDKDCKSKLIDILNNQVYIDGQNYLVSNAIHQYLRNIFLAFEEQNLEQIQFFKML